MFNATTRAIGIGSFALLALGACTVNNPPTPAAPSPTPIVVTPSAPATGTVIVQPKPY